MSDPFSLVIGATGLVKAASDISVVLVKVVRGVKNAPALAEAALKEVMDMSPIFQQLKYFVLNLDKTDSARKSQLSVDQVLILVSSCIETYSDLNRLLQDIVPDDMSMLDRMKWANRAAEVSSVINRLQTHKASLSLLLQVFVGSSMVEVKEAITELRADMSRFQQDWRSRASSRIGQQPFYSEVSSMSLSFSSLVTDNANGSRSQKDDDGTSTIVPEKAPKPSAESPRPLMSKCYDFDADLMTSRPYRNIRLNDYDSVISSANSDPVALSAVTGISLDDISNASFLHLLITREELSNPEHYKDSNNKPYKLSNELLALDEFPCDILAAVPLGAVLSWGGFYTKCVIPVRHIRPSRAICGGRRPLDTVQGQVLEILAFSTTYRNRWLARTVPGSNIGWVDNWRLATLTNQCFLGSLQLPGGFKVVDELGPRDHLWRTKLYGFGACEYLYSQEVANLASIGIIADVSCNNEHETVKFTANSLENLLFMDTIIDTSLTHISWPFALIDPCREAFADRLGEISSGFSSRKIIRRFVAIQWRSNQEQLGLSLDSMLYSDSLPDSALIYEMGQMKVRLWAVAHFDHSAPATFNLKLGIGEGSTMIKGVCDMGTETLPPDSFNVKRLALEVISAVSRPQVMGSLTNYF